MFGQALSTCVVKDEGEWMKNDAAANWLRK
ncbi:MAG: hypothetical protein QOD29_6352, partial [Alphaproteobacteria bacterium]|nr:hypothetical protein [Alphaproteobacteria bacterium]